MDFDVVQGGQVTSPAADIPVDHELRGDRQDPVTAATEQSTHPIRQGDELPLGIRSDAIPLHGSKFDGQSSQGGQLDPGHGVAWVAKGGHKNPGQRLIGGHVAIVALAVRVDRPRGIFNRLIMEVDEDLDPPRFARFWQGPASEEQGAVLGLAPGRFEQSLFDQTKLYFCSSKQIAQIGDRQAGASGKRQMGFHTVGRDEDSCCHA